MKMQFNAEIKAKRSFKLASVVWLKRHDRLDEEIHLGRLQIASGVHNDSLSQFLFVEEENLI
jgi:hypothetical protein